MHRMNSSVTRKPGESGFLGSAGTRILSSHLSIQTIGGGQSSVLCRGAQIPGAGRTGD